MRFYSLRGRGDRVRCLPLWLFPRPIRGNGTGKLSRVEIDRGHAAAIAILIGTVLATPYLHSLVPLVIVLAGLAMAYVIGGGGRA